MSYSDQQVAVINSNSKRLAVLAGAGAGKSHTMVGKVKRFIQEGTAPKNIAVITFTNEATDSLIEKLEKQGVDTDGLTTKTLHSFCYYLIKIIYGFNSRPMPKIIQSPDMFMGTFWKLVGTYDKKDEGDHGSKMPHKSWKQYYEYIYSWQLRRESPEAIIKQFYEKTPNEFKLLMLSKSAYRERMAWAALFYLEYESWKQSTRQVDFNDLILVAIKELEKANERVISFIRNKFKVIIIDEMQDTNALVVDVLKLMTTPETTVIMVGDIRQSIYSFINASPKVIMNYVEYDKFDRLSLNYNYRSSTEIVDNGNYFVSHYPSFNIGGDTVPTKPNIGFPVVSMVSESEIEEVHKTFDLIDRLVKQGYKYKDICIMYRTNAQAMLTLHFCVKRDLPFNIKKDSASIFDRSEMKDILAYLKIFNETDMTKFEDWKRIVNKPTRYVSNKTLEAASNKSGTEVGFGTDLLNNYQSDQKIREFVRTMREHIRAAKKLPLCQQIDYIMNVVGYSAWWEGSDDKDRFFDLSLYANALREITANQNSYRDLIKQINEVRKAIRERNSEDGITFTTIHSSKGLEWPVCLVLGVCSRLYPFYRAVEEDGQEGLEEEARLFYVASTRPIERLYYSEIHGHFGKFEVLPSEFIRQTQRQLIDGDFIYGENKDSETRYPKGFFGNLINSL